MRITGFGHICFLAEIEPAPGAEPVRLLADPWLSDVAVGDLMGRYPRVRVSGADLGRLDAIWISHSHTDHLDPASLLRLWGELDPRPPLLLPQSLRFLGPLLEEYLDGVELVFLEEGAEVDLRGVTIRALFNPERHATNEDDVMVLVAETARERLVSESDAVLPFWNPEERARLGALLADPEKESCVFITAKNELEATMASLAARDLADRRARIGASLEKIYAELEELYTSDAAYEAALFDAPSDGDEYSEYEDADEQDDEQDGEREDEDEFPDDFDEPDGPEPFSSSRLVRLIGGQGMGFPQALGTDWNRVLFPVRLCDRVRMEREVAARARLPIQIEELVPGSTHTVEDGELRLVEECSFVRCLDDEKDRRFDPEIEQFDDFPIAPIRDESRDRDAQDRRILEYLNGRFLPWFIGTRQPPLEHAMAAAGGAYRIRVRFGDATTWEDADYRVGFESLRFERAPAEGDAREHYWANDLEDILDGRADEFSTFPRRPIGAPDQALQRAMGIPYLNPDLIERKLRYHFDLAARGVDSAAWVLALHAGSGERSSEGGDGASGSAGGP